LESLAEWDALISFSTFHYNNPNYAFADIDEQLIIDGKEIGHPLIHSKVRVANDFSLGNPANVMLVTGANMAGKSTFLRAIGVNYILALNGAPVCASQWKCAVATLRSGMRTSDSLKDHASYFYAELNRLQSIIEELRTRKPVIILLDEILKGTNSNDKLAGSRELIKQFIDKNTLVLIATHDILLGDMETQYPNRILNTCFEGRIENDQLTFDYKLNRGLAQRANATFLMKKMGIIPHK
ncbi:MAG TPA: DNA mismatch repair protein, partial [Cyclobacteriaceae bacterium]|nr:DNA mismatch repair protein [Cyclobacteriaceae bacterium]